MVVDLGRCAHGAWVGAQQSADTIRNVMCTCESLWKIYWVTGDEQRETQAVLTRRSTFIMLHARIRNGIAVVCNNTKPHACLRSAESGATRHLGTRSLRLRWACQLAAPFGARNLEPSWRSQEAEPGLNLNCMRAAQLADITQLLPQETTGRPRLAGMAALHELCEEEVCPGGLKLTESLNTKACSHCSSTNKTNHQQEIENKNPLVVPPARA